MTFTPSHAEAQKHRVLSVARELIHDTGDFDLPMRMLAARARVSLRTPYRYFGSKAGVIGAILQQDIEAFKVLVADRRSVDELEHLIDRALWGIDFYAENEPFYRSLFRATQAYSPGHDEEPVRESSRSFQILCNRAHRAGLIRSEVDPLQLGDSLTDVWASNLRTWACSEYDIQLAGRKIGFGFACILAGVAPEPRAGRMREHITRFRREIDTYGGVPSLGPPRRA